MSAYNHFLRDKNYFNFNGFHKGKKFDKRWYKL